MKHDINEEDDIDEQDIRINKVIEGIDKNNIMALLRAWEKYLESVLVFPFEAEIKENPNIDEEIFYKHKRVRVKKIRIIDDLYGIIVETWIPGIKKGRRKYDLPLCILEVTDKNSPNYQPVDDYSIWFVNR